MRKSALVFLVVAVCLTALLGGCSTCREEKAARDAVIGVVETRGTVEKSSLVFYDADLDEVERFPLEYATLGSIFYDPLVYKNNLYAIPQGRGNVKDGKTAIEVDLGNLRITSYAIDQPAMNAIAANDEFIYTCNTLNGVSYINRCEIGSDSVESIAIEGRYVTNIVFAEGYLYAFSDGLDEANLSVLCYDDDLELIEAIDLNGFGSGQYRAALYEGDIFFTSFEESEKAKYIGVLSTGDNTVGRIELNLGNSISVVPFDGHLYVIHYDLIQKSNASSLSVVDLDTYSIEEYDFSHGAEQMTIAGRSMYILAERRIYHYDLSDMSLIESVEVDHSEGEPSYISGIFTIDSNDI